jgi:hypothetical protein
MIPELLLIHRAIRASPTVRAPDEHLAHCRVNGPLGCEPNRPAHD